MNKKTLLQGLTVASLSLIPISVVLTPNYNLGMIILSVFLFIFGFGIGNLFSRVAYDYESGKSLGTIIAGLIFAGFFLYFFFFRVIQTFESGRMAMALVLVSAISCSFFFFYSRVVEQTDN